MALPSGAPSSGQSSEKFIFNDNSILDYIKAPDMSNMNLNQSSTLNFTARKKVITAAEEAVIEILMAIP